MKRHTIFLTALFLSHSLVYAETFSASNVQSQMNDLSSRLQQYTDADALTRYQAYKAKMWLSYAVNQHSERSLTTAGQEALQHVESIVNGLESEQNLSLTTPILSVSQVMRRDLWWQVEYLKQHGAIDHAPESLAHAEVMLVWAAAEYCELGWKHAKEHFNAAEQALYQTVQSTKLSTADITWNAEQLPSLQQLNGQGCRGVNAELWPLAHLKQDQESKRLSLNHTVHFALDRSDLSPASKVVVQQWAVQLNQYPQLSIVLKGYTDSHASRAYNMKLAERRIQTVQNYLILQGMNPLQIDSEIKGPVDFQTDGDIKIAEAKSRRVIFHVADANGIHIEYVPQWEDLQIESEQQKAKVN